MDAFQHAISKQRDLKRRFAELESAHVAQQALVQRLQEQLRDTVKFRATIKKQERVIRKYEEFLKGVLNASQRETLDTVVASVRGSPGGDTRAEDQQRAQQSERPAEGHPEKNEKPPRQAGENDSRTQPAAKPGTRTESGTDVQQDANCKSSIGNSYLDGHSRECPTERTQAVLSTDDVEILKLLLRAETAEARASALEQELVENAKTYGRQIAELRMQLEARGPRASPDPVLPTSDLLRPPRPSSSSFQKLRIGGKISPRSSSPAGATRIKPSGYLDPIVLT